MNEIIGLTDKGESVLILVLEPGNIHMLREGRPIQKHIQDYFPDGIPKKLDLVIHFSMTPFADSKKFREMAQIVVDEKSAKQVRPHCPECKSTIEQLGVWRNESVMALTFCSECGCIFGMVPSEIVKGLR